MVAKRKAKSPGPAEKSPSEVEAILRRLVKEGFAAWSGGKPHGSNPPIEITEGPPISDYVVEDRR